MKTTSHLCDFCGGEIAIDEQPATLTVPLTEEQKLLQRRMNGGYRRMDPEVELLFASLTFGASRKEQAAITYDMCRACLTGLLRARLATVAALREAHGR